MRRKPLIRLGLLLFLLGLTGAVIERPRPAAAFGCNRPGCSATLSCSDTSCCCFYTDCKPTFGGCFRI